MWSFILVYFLYLHLLSFTLSAFQIFFSSHPPIAMRSGMRMWRQRRQRSLSLTFSDPAICCGGWAKESAGFIQTLVVALASPAGRGQRSLWLFLIPFLYFVSDIKWSKTSSVVKTHRFNAVLRHCPNSLSGYCGFKTKKRAAPVLLVVGMMFRGTDILAHSHCWF